MAATSLNAVRVRLYFDYPPPGVSDCRMCWVLVDLNKCRVVADLASVIREKFDFSRRTILNLFIEDCYLPPTESVYVVRDNDSIRVKVENQPLVNGTKANCQPEGLSQKANKRTRESDEESEESRAHDKKKKKKKKAPIESQEVDPQPDAEVEKRKKKKRKKLKEKNLPVNPEAAVKRTTPSKEPAVSKPVPDKAGKKPTTPANTAASKAAKLNAASSSSESSSDSSPDAAGTKPIPKKTDPPKKQTLPAMPANTAASKATKLNAALPSSSETSDSSEEEPPKKAAVVKAPSRPGMGVNVKASGGVTGVAKAGNAASTSSETSSDSSPGPAGTKPIPKKTDPPKKQTLPATPSAAKALPKQRHSSSSSSSDSDSATHTRLANKRAGLTQQVPPLAAGPSCGLPLGAIAGRGRVNPRGGGRGVPPGAGRGVGRGDGRFPWRGGRSPGVSQRGGQGRANCGAGNHVFYDYGNQNGSLQPQRHADDVLTNEAVVLQNPPERAPKRDYESFPLLAAPPPVGQKIAFKLLELTENYTPEVSDYKEGKIVGINQSTNQIELELLSFAPEAPAEPGKFDLVYQNADGSEIVEYAVSRTSQLTERWDSLLEPRLILENKV